MCPQVLADAPKQGYVFITTRSDQAALPRYEVAF